MNKKYMSKSLSEPEALRDLQEYGRELSEKFPELKFNLGTPTYIALYKGEKIVASLIHTYGANSVYNGLHATFFDAGSRGKFPGFGKKLIAMTEFEDRWNNSTEYAYVQSVNQDLVLEKFPALLKEYLELLKE
jgi:hypothetical protein